MADLFSITSPLMIRSPHGGEKVVAELYPHPDGIVFFEIFWNHEDEQNGIYVIEGDVTGEGPWKVGEYVINILGCHGTNPALVEDFAQWQTYLQSALSGYPKQDEVDEVALSFGAYIPA
ncbi:MAG: hypothetical protein HUJ30_03085 [Gammaproteobacteria bacterium]|nr:hypothetical protein [Gammaproteobacteria bacterium]